MQNHLSLWLVMFLFSGLISAQMTVKDSDTHMLMQVNDEGSVGSITVPSGPEPSTPTNKLYNISGSLYWNGSALATSGSAGGWTDDGAVVRLTNGTDKVGIGISSPAMTLDVKDSLGINGMRLLYLPDQTDFEGSLILGNGGNNLAHSVEGTGCYNTAIGIGGLNSIAQGAANTASGYQALYSSDNDYENTANGAWALFSNTSGSRNTAAGARSLYLNNGGYENTAIGYQSLHENTSGSYNIGMGARANFYNEEGSNNTIIGHEAGMGISAHNKSGNIFIGYQAGYNETGDNKLYIENSSSSSPLIGGDFSADEIYLNGHVGIGTHTPVSKLEVNGRIELPDNDASGTEGSGSIEIGNSLRIDANEIITDTDGELFLQRDNNGDLSVDNGSLFVDASTNRVGIGTHTPVSKLEVNGRIELPGNDASGTAGSGSIEIGNYLRFDDNEIITNTDGELFLQRDNNGDLSVDNGTLFVDASANSVGVGITSPTRKLFVNGDAGGLTSWYNDSDGRLKKNIETIPKALDKVQKLRGVNFEWKESQNHEPGRKMGFIAQESETVIPEVVSNSGYTYSMQYAPITALLVEAIKEQQNIIEEQQKRIEALEKRNR